jgi:hypothetical protein
MRQSWVFSWSVSSSYLHNRRHGPVIVPLYLEIGHPAVALGGLDPGMPQEILDGHQGGIGIGELGGQGCRIISVFDGSCANMPFTKQLEVT